MTVSVAMLAPAEPDALATVDAGLVAYNAKSAPFDDVAPLHVIATDAEGVVYGGAIGRTWGSCCELQQLWVSEKRRRCGDGTLLMDRFEQEALRRGCDLIYLDTFSFQAPEFYIKRGFVEVLRTTGFTGGVVRMTMHKRVHQ